jgi:hypothetical protein
MARSFLGHGNKVIFLLSPSNQAPLSGRIPFSPQKEGIEQPPCRAGHHLEIEDKDSRASRHHSCCDGDDAAAAPPTTTSTTTKSTTIIIGEEL